MTTQTAQTQFSLQTLLEDSTVVFRTHNVKITTLNHDRDLPQSLLAHFDNIDDDVKHNYTITPQLIKQFHSEMTAKQAAEILNLPPAVIRTAYHIKISGTAVIVCDELPLALHLHFSNTAKAHQAVYGNDLSELIKTQAERWQLSGNVNLLHKNPNHQITSYDLNEQAIVIDASQEYVRLPNDHALATTHTLNQLKDNNPERLQFLHDAIVEKIMQVFAENQGLN